MDREVAILKHHGHFPVVRSSRFFKPNELEAFDAVIVLSGPDEITTAYEDAGVHVVNLRSMDEMAMNLPRGWARQRPVQDGMWKGQRAFVVGGGPSLENFDWRLLQGENTVGVNRAHEFFHPTICCSMDNRFWHWTEAGRFGEEAKASWRRHPRKIMVRTGARSYGDMARTVEQVEGQHCFSGRLEDGLGHGENSGFPAVNLAVVLGANPIYLLGFDMQERSDRSHFHNGYGDVEQKATYATYLTHWNNLPSEGLPEIVNLNTDSALDRFPKKSLQEVEFEEPPVYVCYYTENTAYEQEAEHLRKSLDAFHLDYEIQSRPSRGSWELNCNYKAKFIREMLNKYRHRRVVWLDADARLVRFPQDLHEIEEDFAVHRLNGHELISATMYFAPGSKSRRLVERWIQVNRDNPQEWDQRNLDKALKGWRGKEGNLAVEYCAIVGHKTHPIEPVIIQTQASRRLKKTVSNA
jgi:hypothetical protein